MTGFEKTKDGFRIFCDDEKFSAAFEKMRESLRERRGEILRDAMNEPKRKRLVLKTEIAGSPVVLKRECFIFRFDRSLKALLFGSDARNIFRVSLCAQKKGFHGIPRTFLVAEKFTKGILRETISAMEFLDGIPPRLPLSRKQAEEIETLMNDCHANGIISGDVHPGNFLMTRDGAKLIDFRGEKVFPCIAKARDRLQLERVFGIPDRSRGIGEKLFFIQHALRNVGRKLRGKAPIPD